LLKIQAVYELRLKSYVKDEMMKGYALTFRKDFNLDEKQKI